MNATALKAKIVDAKRRLLTAESVMESALKQITDAPRTDKAMIGTALGTALAEMKAAREDLVALEKVISQED